MIYYFIFFLLLVLSVFQIFSRKDRTSIFGFYTVVISLILLAGLRGDVEPDYANYQEIFESSKNHDNLDLNIEPGYFYLNKILASAHIPFQAIIFLFAAVSVFLIVRYLYQNSINFYYSILIYYSTVFFPFNFIQIRQALTLSIFVSSIYLIKKQAFFLYLLVLVVVSFIHISALMLIPLYFVLNRVYKNWTIIVLLAICACINLLEIKISLLNVFLELIPIPSFLISKLNVYLSRTEFTYLSSKQLLLAFLFLWLKTKIKNENKDLNIYFNLYFLGILIATIFNNLPELSFRMKWYFLWSESILVVYLIHYISKQRILAYVTLYIVIGIAYFIGLESFLSEISNRGDYIFPYRIFSF